MRSRQPSTATATARAARPREASVQHAIREALGLEADLVLWRNAVSGVETWDPSTGRSRVHHAGLPVGSADLVGILRVVAYAPGAHDTWSYVGRFIALEVKRPGEKPRAEQVQWLDLVRRFGGFAAVVSSVEEARAALVRARRGDDR